MRSMTCVSRGWISMNHWRVLAPASPLRKTLDSALSSRSTPSTDCSASIECGGTFRFSSWESELGCGTGWAMKALETCGGDFTASGKETHKQKEPPDAALPYQRLALSLLLRGFSQHRYLDVDYDVGVQRDGDGMIPYRFQPPLRQADHRALDLEPLPLERLDDVEIRDRAEQVSVDACLLGDLDHETLQLCTFFLCPFALS